MTERAVMSKKKKTAAEFRFYELPQDEPVLALMGSKWIQVYGENKSEYHQECVRGLVYALLFEIAGYNGRRGMAAGSKSNVFRQKMNMTPVEYVNFVRVKKACELIDKTDISMVDVAEKVGFVTPSTFKRNFRRIIGTSPYQWKKRPDNHEGKLLDYNISTLKGW